MSTVTEQDVLSALRSCYDPEIPVNIVDLMKQADHILDAESIEGLGLVRVNIIPGAGSSTDAQNVFNSSLAGRCSGDSRSAMTCTSARLASSHSVPYMKTPPPWTGGQTG